MRISKRIKLYFIGILYNFRKRKQYINEWKIESFLLYSYVSYFLIYIIIIIDMIVFFLKENE